jgi:medium-chain acyl-[acyl-carrier-protein] hydrolase
MNIFEKVFQVHSFELDFKGKVKPAVLLNYLQEAATEHATALGYSVIDLRRKNLTWVLSRYHIQIYRYPGYGEDILIKTWPSAVQSLFALRDFEILDSKKNKIGSATSSWLMLDLSKGKPISLETFLPHFSTYGTRAIDDEFKSLPELKQVEIHLPFRVRMNDLDLNQHVNHTIYIQWALETVPPNILKNKRPIRIEIGFRAEAFYGDRIISQTQWNENLPNPSFLHKLVEEKKGTELTRLRTFWK